MKRPSIKDQELSKLLNAALDAAFEARKVHIKFYKQLKNIRNKLDSSLVSEADQESENVIKKILRDKFEDIDILGEEGGLDKVSQKKSLWLVDPLDGTTNYIHGYPFFCTSIGLELDGEIVLGVVDSALLERTYWAVKGFGAYCNQKQIFVSEAKKVTDSLVATGFLSYGGEELDRQLQIFKSLIQKSRGVRRSGSAALELCLLAEGALDGFWEYELKPWDTAAGSIIVQEAGGKVSDNKGNPFHPSHSAVVASNGFIHSDLLNLVK